MYVQATYRSWFNYLLFIRPLIEVITILESTSLTDFKGLSEGLKAPKKSIYSDYF